MNNGVAHLTLGADRVDESVARALCDAAEAIELDDDVAVVVIEGRQKSFCLAVADGGDWQDRFDWVAAIGSLTCPVVAAVNGDATAEGCELTLACDLRIVKSGARFSLPQLREGRLPRHGATQYLPRIVGRTRAMQLLLSGRIVSAREALTIGLASEVVAPRSFRRAVGQTVQNLCDKGPLALRLAKEAVVKGLDLTLDQGIRLEQDLYVLLQTTADRREGIDAFLKKRRPVFRGN